MAAKLFLFDEVLKSSDDDNWDDNSFAAVILPVVAGALYADLSYN